jgi:hypothetical protein
MRRLISVAFAVSCLTGTACAATLTGRVFVDRNRDGVRQANEPGLGGVVVARDRDAFVESDADGVYRLDVATPTGIIWARVPDGFRPGPVWRPADGPDLDLPLVELTAEEAAAPLAFVVAADSHTPSQSPTDPWDGGDLADAIDQAVSLPTPPRFFTIVGDVTQGNAPDQFAAVDAALAGIDVPWVPVPGNHDWYDGGTEWRRHWGPDNYSFDVGNLHVVVWDANLPEATQVAFFAADLAWVDPAMIVVGLGHGSPRDEVADQLAALGVDYLFTGHWHANRKVERTGLTEWGTQTFIMGGIDQSPAGYRIVTFDGTAAPPTVVHRERLVTPHLGVVAPSPWHLRGARRRRGRGGRGPRRRRPDGDRGDRLWLADAAVLGRRLALPRSGRPARARRPRGPRPRHLAGRPRARDPGGLHGLRSRGASRRPPAPGRSSVEAPPTSAVRPPRSPRR